MRMFRNDYSEGAAPEVLQALIDTNEEQCPGYTEGDVHCERARALIRDAVGLPDAAVEFCVGGTSVNLIAVTGMLRDWEGVIATPLAHIATHETGAIARAGRTILLTNDTDGFVSPDAAERVYGRQMAGGRHMTKPALIYIADTTEIGGVWSRKRFFALADWADAHDVPIYVDGARLASALEAKDADLTLEDIAQRASAFTLGGTKDGLLFGEALVFTDSRLQESFPYLQKELGGLVAKGRLLGVQFERAFTPDADGDLPWLRYARQANACAERLFEGLSGLGFEPYGGHDSNQLFFYVTEAEELAFRGACGSETISVLPDGRRIIRFVTSWATKIEDTDELVSFAATLR
ncbi:MAG: beta-eliminating lyase-related protein [Atopobiaceae bacterium]|jgi:threonine aldolase|nr:beta-eliminating lyase-related protein [Atopobiaceae bacterium]MCI2050913.1 beta-eliminating lyase-related protein [Atopobiaceae bacterium]